MRVALVGNPNCGKTTLFNALTGSSQRVGNWPGVTVERKEGCFKCADTYFDVIDLPGIYSLSVSSESSVDARIAAEYMIEHQADLLVNVLDATNLERNLYLTTQLLELEIPMIVVVNMIDISERRGMDIDTEKLSKILGCPVVTTASNKSIGIDELKHLIVTSSAHVSSLKSNKNLTKYNQIIEDALSSIKSLLMDPAVKPLDDGRLDPAVNPRDDGRKNIDFMAIRLLESDLLAQSKVGEDIVDIVRGKQQNIYNKLHEDADILIADARYDTAHNTVKKTLTTKQQSKRTLTHLIDNVVLNRWLGIPIFLIVMYLIFTIAINVGGVFQDFFNLGSQAIFVQGSIKILSYFHFSNWLITIIASGIGKGLSTTITFIPVLGMMFFMLSLLEECGYMARAAFVVDKFMSKLGLPGKAFVPMIVGFGCTVPAIMATRTLEHKRDRVLTVMMTPFISCGARLAVYAVFTSAFFPHGGQNVVFALYMIGIGIAVLTGLILRKTILAGKQSSLIMELPPYHVPVVKNLIRHSWHRLKSFLLKAGKIIVPVCLLIGVLNSINVDGAINYQGGSKNSILSEVGRVVTPVFKPIGIKQDNWQATVGLMTGITAKEVIVGTLNTLYTQKKRYTCE